MQLRVCVSTLPNMIVTDYTNAVRRFLLVEKKNVAKNVLVKLDFKMKLQS